MKNFILINLLKVLKKEEKESIKIYNYWDLKLYEEILKTKILIFKNHIKNLFYLSSLYLEKILFLKYQY